MRIIVMILGACSARQPVVEAAPEPTTIEDPKLTIVEPEAPGLPTIGLSDLVKAGEFELTFTGRTEEAFLSKKQCVWYTSTIGEKAEGEWVVQSEGYTTEKTVYALVASDNLEVTWRKLRPHLSPSFTKTVARADADQPPWATTWFSSQDSKTVTFEEFCLEKDKTYFACVGGEDYHLPPEEPDGPPQEQTNQVLIVSDAPFQDGKPTVELVPVFRHWTY